MVNYIDSSNLISKEEKYKYIKLFRSMLSNYEQALLFFNALSSIGKRWMTNNWIVTYKMIKNIPHNFLNPLNPKEYFPKIIFEFEEDKRNIEK